MNGGAGQLDILRRVAQLDPPIAVVTEMAGNHGRAPHVCEMLSRRDRSRVCLRVGTTLSKDGEHGYAARVMAIRDFEEENEPDGRSMGHQKPPGTAACRPLSCCGSPRQVPVAV